jgi:hypothetical protein
MASTSVLISTSTTNKHASGWLTSSQSVYSSVQRVVAPPSPFLYPTARALFSAMVSFRACFLVHTTIECQKFKAQDQLKLHEHKQGIVSSFDEHADQR